MSRHRIPSPRGELADDELGIPQGKTRRIRREDW